MQGRPNPLKAAVTAGQPYAGLWCSLASALTPEAVAGSGPGWLLIVGRHGPDDLRTMAAASHPRRLTPTVISPMASPWSPPARSSACWRAVPTP